MVLFSTDWQMLPAHGRNYPRLGTALRVIFNGFALHGPCFAVAPHSSLKANRRLPVTGIYQAIC